MAVAWCFADERHAGAEAILDSLSQSAQAIAPSIWPFEVANALLIGERRNRISVAQVTLLLRHLGNLPITLDPVQTESAFERILPFARQERLTEYDATYLELAIREGLPLATLDADLRRAARKVGVRLAEM